MSEVEKAKKRVDDYREELIEIIGGESEGRLITLDSFEQAVRAEAIAERDELRRKKMGDIADRQRAFAESPNATTFSHIVRQTIIDCSTIIKSAIEELRKQ
jgi:hypothetical protein